MGKGYDPSTAFTDSVSSIWYDMEKVQGLEMDGAFAITIDGGAGYDIYVVPDTRALASSQVWGSVELTVDQSNLERVELIAERRDSNGFHVTSSITLTNVELIKFEDEEIQISATSDSGTDTGTGSGSSKPDKLSGDASNDVLFGYGGNDKLNGAAGDDRLIGGEGIDKLTGGTGADVFVFDNLSSSGASAADKITDFKVSEGDTFAFDASVFISLAGGITADNIVIAAKVKAMDPDDFILMTTKGKLYYDVDGSGSSAAVLIAGVKGSFSGIDYTSFVIDVS